MLMVNYQISGVQKSRSLARCRDARDNRARKYQPASGGVHGPIPERVAVMAIVATMDILGLNIKDLTMKVMTARDAKNHFGEFLDAARREPVIVTKNDRPVGIMISIEDAADTLLPEMLLDKEPGYDGWLFEKVTSTIRRVDSGETALLEHDEAMEKLRKRLAERFGARTA